MIVVGTQGFAKELLEILSVEMKMKDEEILLFDNVSNDLPIKLFGKFKILKSFEEAEAYFKNYNNHFTLGLGNSQYRESLAKKFQEIGGVLTTLISEKASIGSFSTDIGEGCQIMQGVVITNDVKIGQGVLINLNSTISHDCEIEDFVEIACGVNIAGRCKIKRNTFIGTNVTINPDITIGRNSIVGAGSVVIKDVPDNVTVAGVPARIIRCHE